MFRWRMRCDHKTKMQHSTTIWLTIYRHSWISFYGNICVLPSNFVHLSLWGCSMTIWPMTTSFTDLTRLLLTNFRTLFLQLFNWMTWNPAMIFKSPVWIMWIGNSGWMGFNGVRQKSGIWQMLVNKLTRQKNVYLRQRHWSSRWYSETWLDHIIKVSHHQSLLLMHLSSLFWNPWQNLQFFPSW